MVDEVAPAVAPAHPFVLVPGFWLGAWAWDEVAALLRARGHEVVALTLPGLEETPAPGDAPATGDAGGAVGAASEPVAAPEAEPGATIEGHVAAVVAAARALPGAVLVGHSGAAPVVQAAADELAGALTHVVYVDSGPLPPGTPVRPDLPEDATEVPLPPWSELTDDGNSLEGLDDARLVEFRRRARPHPAGAAGRAAPIGERWRETPSTVVCTSMSSADLRGLAASGHPFFAALGGSALVDLPTGHWPMWSRPQDLADLLATLARTA